MTICKDIEKHDASTLAEDYGPKALMRQRERWVKSGKRRKYCNTLTNSAIRMFRWSVAEEQVAVSVVERIKAIEPLTGSRAFAELRKARNQAFDHSRIGHRFF